MEAQQQQAPKNIPGLTVGRDCHFFVEGQAEPYAAKIVGVHDASTGEVSLCLFDRDGTTRGRRALFAEQRTPGHWSWMARV